MSASSTQAEHSAYRMRQDLEKCMVSEESSTRCFVPQRSIDRCWPEDPETLKEKLGLHSWHGEHGDLLISVLRQECRIVASILAWIEYHNFANELEALCSSILNPADNTHRRDESSLKDSDLAIDRKKCEDLFGLQAGRAFYQDQFIFTPIVVKAGAEVIQEVHSDSRWPWDSSTKELIGSGAYGTVYKVNIVKGQLQPSPDPFSDKDDLVAYKSVQKPKDWIKEVENLDFLKGSLSHHDRLTLHYAALVQDRDLYIFMPYTPLGDLETFLREGARLDDASIDRTVYDFRNEFEIFGALDLAQEFVCIINATAYLHDKVSSVRGTLVYCVHSDLRPHNILVFPGHSQNRVGVWRISDFGISSFKVENGRTPNAPVWAKYPSVGDVFKERWSSSGSLSTSLRPPGTYVGPERQLRGLEKLKENDVWSLGCIFTEVLVFGLGSNQKGSRKRQLDDFRRERRKTQGPGLDRNDYFYDLEKTAIGVDTEIVFRRRDKVDEWLTILFDGHSPLYKELAIVVHRMLQPDPTLRDTASLAYDLALKVCNLHFADGSHSQRPRAMLFKEFDRRMLRAKEWRVLAFQPSDEDSSDSLTLKQVVSNSPELQTETLSPTPTQELDRQFDFPRAQSIEARAVPPGFWSGDDCKFARPALKVKISDSCGVAVYLCKRPGSRPSSLLRSLGRNNIKFVYELRFRKPWQQTHEFEDDASCTYELPESGSVHWQELHVNGQNAIVVGTHPSSRTKTTHIYDFINRSEITLTRSASVERMHKLATSVRGWFVAHDDKEFALWRSWDSHSTQAVSPPFSAIGQAVLGSSGCFLFTWSCGYGQDVLQIWKTDSMDEAQVCATHYIPRPGDHAPREMLLIPCGSLPACVMRDGRGTWYTASMQPGADHQEKRAIRQRALGTDLPTTKALYAANERCLFFVTQNQEIWACSLVWSDDATLMLERQPEALARTKVKYPASIALYMKESGKHELVICDVSGAVENIEVEC